MTISKAFLFFLFCIQAFAVSWSFTHEHKYNGSKVIIQGKHFEGIQTVSAKLNGKEFFNKERAVIGERYKRSEIIGNYFFIICGKGVHGETTFVYDLKKMKVLFTKNASWPVEIKKNKKQVKLIWQEEGDNKGNFKDYSKVFSFK